MANSVVVGCGSIGPTLPSCFRRVDFPFEPERSVRIVTGAWQPNFRHSTQREFGSVSIEVDAARTLVGRRRGGSDGFPDSNVPNSRLLSPRIAA